MRSLVLLAITTWLAAAPLSAQAPAGEPATARWFKGNTHAHTLNSDGDSAPDEVVRWYREQRYHFLVVTDHNLVTPVDGLNAAFAFEDQFLVIAGEEITDRAGGKPVHVNALGVRTAIPPQGGASVAEALQRDVAAAQAAGAPAQINHPNFGWAVAASDVPASPVPLLLEIFNGHPQVNNLGGGDAPGAEGLWDDWLSSGRTVFAVASDDTHHLKRPWDRQASRPGRGWVMVRATTLSADAILGALLRGEFYASTGVELSDWQATPRGVSIAVRPQGT
ncbi:MAG TPA: CehA/McbA family metallohydrolase, partial [Vicinamibacterales bacterium]|nr:CehA/McbA family metallohydrolase [Vicinamibacterales bacterium]